MFASGRRSGLTSFLNFWTSPFLKETTNAFSLFRFPEAGGQTPTGNQVIPTKSFRRVFSPGLDPAPARFLFRLFLFCSFSILPFLLLAENSAATLGENFPFYAVFFVATDNILTLGEGPIMFLGMARKRILRRDGEGFACDSE